MALFYLLLFVLSLVENQDRLFVDFRIPSVFTVWLIHLAPPLFLVSTPSNSSFPQHNYRMLSMLGWISLGLSYMIDKDGLANGREPTYSIQNEVFQVNTASVRAFEIFSY